MKRSLTTVLAFMGFSLSLTSHALASDRRGGVPDIRRPPADSTSEAPEKTNESQNEKNKKVEIKEETSAAATAESGKAKAAPRGPASSQELLSTDTVEYLKDAGKKVEGYFEPIGKK